MAKPRKKWEPKHQFGGNPAEPFMPPPLGEGQWRAKLKPKRKKK